MDCGKSDTITKGTLSLIEIGTLLTCDSVYVYPFLMSLSLLSTRIKFPSFF